MAMAIQDKMAARARARWLAAKAGSDARETSALLLFDTIAAVGFAAGIAGAIAAGSMQAWPYMVLAAGSGAARGLFAMAAARKGAADAARAKIRLRRDVVASALRRPAAATLTTGALMSAAIDEVEALDGFVARFAPARKAAAIAPMLVLVAVAFASPLSAAILIATLVPFILAMALAGGAAADQSRRQFTALARLTGHFADRVRALPVVLAFRAEARETVVLAAAANELAERTMRVLRVAFLSSGALEFFAALSVALVAVYCGFNLLGLLPFPVPEQLTLWQAFFVLALAPEFYGPLRRLAAAYHDKQAAETAADRLMALPAPAAAPAMSPRTEPPRLRFADVAIRYAGEDADVITGFSLDVAPGATVALLGPSGSGKTSLLHMLLGLAPLTGGQVLIDDDPLGAEGSVAPIAAWAGQHPLIIAGTIRDNLRLARANANAQDLAQVIQSTGLGPMLAHRPQGLDTQVDSRGGGLSGGERRRIALARALLTSAPLLLLDEPTAHLDSAAEAALIATIDTARRGRTTLIATHSERLAAIADHVVHLGGGA